LTADFRKPLTLLISAHLRALSVPTFSVIVELRCINAGTDKSIGSATQVMLVTRFRATVGEKLNRNQGGQQQL
jgi:hypothetical protein